MTTHSSTAKVKMQFKSLFVAALTVNTIIFSQAAMAADTTFRLTNKSFSSPLSAKVPLKAKAIVNTLPLGELEELNAYADQFSKRLNINSDINHWTKVPFRHKLFLYTIEREKFLGSCSVARLDQDEKDANDQIIIPDYKYYLL